MGIDKTVKSNKILLFMAGSICLVLGITLILLWWEHVIGMFKALVALLLALTGLILLDMVKESDG